jgi:hypothetical protein
MVTENVPPTDSPLLNGFQYKNIVKANFHLQFTCQQLESQGHIYSPSVLTLTDVKELYRITKLFSKCKKVTNEKERKTDIEENPLRTPW